MTIVLREIPGEAADAILAGERPGDVRVADDYPTEFSAGRPSAPRGRFTTSSTASKMT